MYFSKKLILHPFLVATYPIIFLLAEKISQINPKDAVRPLLLSLLAALLFMLLFGVVAKDYRQGALSASILLGLFFTYGHLHRILGLQGHTLLLIVWASCSWLACC